MTTKIVHTFTATIYVGFRVGRTGEDAVRVHTMDEARAVVQSYCNEHKLCVTMTPTEYVYVDGGEPGVSVGLINYPRFPKELDELHALTMGLAVRLKDAMEQYKVSVVMPGETVMLGTEPPATESQVQS